MDYVSSSPGGLVAGLATMAVPDPLPPAARAHEVPRLAEAPVSLAELEGVLNDAAAEAEGELAELGQWFRQLSPLQRKEALASVARELEFAPAEAPAPAGPPRSAAPAAAAPALTVYADSSLTAPAAPATAPLAAARPSAAPLGDRTNRQHHEPKALKSLTSKIHIAHSQRATVQVGRLMAGEGWQGAGACACAQGPPRQQHMRRDNSNSPRCPWAAGRQGGCAGAAQPPAVSGQERGGQPRTLVP